MASKILQNTAQAMPQIQAHVIFKGHVQGVGFRYTVERIAMRLKVVGWVKNLANGDVEVVAEAEEKAIDDFFEQIRSYFKQHIRDEEIMTSNATGSLTDFQVLF